MIFGQSEVFLVEATHQETRNKRPLGGFCLHVAGRSIGDLDDLIDLSNSVNSVKIFLEAAQRRIRPDLDGATTSEIFEVLYQRYTVLVSDLQRTSTGKLLRTSAGSLLRRSAMEPWDRDPYLLDDIGESSIRDKHTILVVGRSDGSDRVVIKSYGDGSLSEVMVEKDVIDDSFREYCAWVASLL
jgi:hypothetical protein